MKRTYGETERSLFDKKILNFRAEEYLPHGNFLERPAYNGMFLIGDAGGFADPLLGEGIYYAHLTAELAAHAIDEGLAHGEDAAAIYRALLHAHVIPEMKRAKVLRTAIYACLDLGLDRPVASFVSVFDRRLIEHTQGRRAAHG